jgi:hypothetical protein
MMNGINELAKMFKDRNNKPYLGPITGTIISAPPEIKISCFDGAVILTKSKVIIAASVLEGYERKISISGASAAPSPVSTMDGTLTFTDTLKPGDEVILVPTTDEQTYFLMDKAVRL